MYGCEGISSQLDRTPTLENYGAKFLNDRMKTGSRAKNAQHTTGRWNSHAPLSIHHQQTQRQQSTKQAHGSDVFWMCAIGVSHYSNGEG